MITERDLGCIAACILILELGQYLQKMVGHQIVIVHWSVNDPSEGMSTLLILQHSQEQQLIQEGLEVVTSRMYGIEKLGSL